MAWLTAEMAEAMCTVIAVGFIQSQTSGPRTVFGYDTGALESEKKNHATLEGALHRLGVEVAINQFVDKRQEPMILAKRPETYEQAILEGAVEPFRTFVALAEREINSGDWGEPPRGAYIGGIMDLGSIWLAGPSDVALAKPPRHRELTAEQAGEMKKAFDNACNATNKAWDFIESEATRSITWNNKTYVTPDTRGKKVTDTYDPQCLFQSVHGMVRAIMEFGAHLGDAGICFELALGNRTNKVASCLPCSLFMSACGTPATSTHLGCGDNWNFPSTFWKRADWEQAVKTHFQAGVNILKAQGTEAEKRVARNMEGVPEAVVPEAFLEALTFEGPFLLKMMRTLKLPIIPKEPATT